jgi:hypothetical protein
VNVGTYDAGQCSIESAGKGARSRAIVWNANE